MIMTGSGGVIEHQQQQQQQQQQADDGKQLLKELEALRNALYRVKRPSDSPQHHPTSPLRTVSEKLPFRAADYHHRRQSSVFRAVRRFSHTISALDFHGIRKHLQLKERSRKEAVENGGKGLHEMVGDFSDWLPENPSFNRKKSLWKWRPMRALAHIWQHKLHCIFHVQVHSISNLPTSMNGLRLTVDFRLKDCDSQTMPCRVSHGSVEFDETLRISCTVFASKKPSHTLKYEPKHFLLSVIPQDVDSLELGRHHLDLTRLLPQSFEEKGHGEKGAERAASFNLTGKAKGGILSASFGYEIVDKEFGLFSGGETSEYGRFSMGRELHVPRSLPNSPRTKSFPQPPDQSLASPSLSTLPFVLGSPGSAENPSISDDNEGFHSSKITHKPRSLSQSDIRPGDITGFHSRGMIVNAQPKKLVAEPDYVEFEVVDRGTEISSLCVNAPVRLPPTLEVEEEGPEAEDRHIADEKPPPALMPAQSSEDSEAKVKHTVREEKALVRIANRPFPEIQRDIDPKMPAGKHWARDFFFANSLEKATQTFRGVVEENRKGVIDEKSVMTAVTVRSKTGNSREGMVANLDDEVDLVAGEFLHMLEEDQTDDQKCSDSEPNSPRALLFKQFQKEASLEEVLALDLGL